MTISYSIADIAHLISAKVIGDDQLQITGLAPLITAQTGHLTYLLGGRYQSLLSETTASAVILTKDDSKLCPVAALVVDNPEYAFAKVARLFDPYKKPKPGIHSSAIVAASAKIPDTVSIGAHCVIGEHTTVGDNTVLSPHVTVGDGVTIGVDCLLHPQVSVYQDCVIGDRVTLHPGVVIGAAGFGLTRTKTGWENIPQIGRVVIHEDVDIGANTCVDRAALADTVIHAGVKIDNLVQIAHNVVIGAHTAIAACTVIGGSTAIGANCMIGGATSISGHLTICDEVILTGCGMVTKSVSQAGVYSSGIGTFPNAAWRKMVVRLRQLDKFMKEKR